MTLEVKDIVYILVYVVSIVTIFLTFRNRLYFSETEIEEITDIIKSKNGSLNLISQSACKESRDQVYKDVRRIESEVRKISSKLDKQGEDITKILYYLEKTKGD